MLTMHLPETKQRGGQTFLYQVEKIFCGPNCVVVEMMTMPTVAGEQRAE